MSHDALGSILCNDCKAIGPSMIMNSFHLEIATCETTRCRQIRYSWLVLICVNQSKICGRGQNEERERLFAWIVLLVTHVTTDSVVWQHLHVFFGQWLTFFVVVDTGDLVALFQGSSHGFQGAHSNPLFSDHGVLSLVQLLAVGVVNIVEGDVWGSCVFWHAVPIFRCSWFSTFENGGF